MVVLSKQATVTKLHIIVASVSNEEKAVFCCVYILTHANRCVLAVVLTTRGELTSLKINSSSCPVYNKKIPWAGFFYPSYYIQYS